MDVKALYKIITDRQATDINGDPTDAYLEWLESVTAQYFHTQKTTRGAGG